jgi:hypothetical protein
MLHFLTAEVTKLYMPVRATDTEYLAEFRVAVPLP